MKRVECPDCNTSYLAERLDPDLKENAIPGKVYTVRCATCDHVFDFEVPKRRWYDFMRRG